MQKIKRSEVAEIRISKVGYNKADKVKAQMS